MQLVAEMNRGDAAGVLDNANDSHYRITTPGTSESPSMCERDPTPLQRLVRQAIAPASAADAGPPLAAAPAQGSRRRKLWELHNHAHCPVVGVCLPLPALRRLADKLLAAPATDDYELHCSVIAECRRRTPLAEAVQRELDRRSMPAMRQAAARAKTTEALRAWWREASEGRDFAATLWATLTHPRCTPVLEQQVLGEVHMLQHQVGMARRVDLQRFESLIEENGVLARELAAAQQRCTRSSADHARRSELQQAEIVQLRAQLIGRDTAIAALRDELQALEAALPDLKERCELVREAERLLEHSHALQRALLQAQQEAERQRRRADASIVERANREAVPADAADGAGGELDARLDNLAVLCVGGRTGSVPLFRQLVEGTGGCFLHHDGGEEESPARLDATLAAADLVICQTGCISHAAYWRVKDHCKRTGKRCVFVETPSNAGLKRALVALAAPAGAASS